MATPPMFKVKKLAKKKKKTKKIWAEYMAEDEYGTNSNCDICGANIDKRPYYELSHSGYISLCIRCARALQRARIIRLREPKPPPTLLIKEKYFTNKNNEIWSLGAVKDLLGDGKLIEMHPKW